jgi:predicted negative regulator of RcsB-dependent stress response
MNSQTGSSVDIRSLVMEPLGALKEYWPLIVLGTNGLVMWGVWSFRKATVSREDFAQFSHDINETIKTNDDEIKAQIGKLDKRITAAESELKHMPSHEDLKHIYGRLDSVAETLSKVAGQSSGHSRQLDTIYQHLISQEKKS